MTNEKGEPLSGPAKGAVRMSILKNIDQFIANKRETIKLLTGQPSTIDGTSNHYSQCDKVVHVLQVINR
jgi:hypothetical protein